MTPSSLIDWSVAFAVAVFCGGLALTFIAVLLVSAAEVVVDILKWASKEMAVAKDD